ncbi:Sulfatase protein [Phytophthora cinnamomi]|uniref:Sulfatase protein n=1 Tax=Phytophthora cinnamomi TaxID=4785 RepID=UPI00355ACBDA|nr:Sulfatase protein [Phytophthora cinnamomi]
MESSPRPKKRKATYLVRREEAQALKQQVQVLREELAALRQAQTSADTKPTATQIRDLLHSQQLAIASTHAMTFDHLSNQPENPIKTYIHLPRNWGARRETLLALKSDMFRKSHSYLTARSHKLDISRDHFTVDEFEDSDGNLICNRFDVTRIRGAKSLKQVYDALVFFMFNMEISISENLGDITVREDYDILDDDAYISNHRLVSNHDSVASEANSVSFAQYFEGENEFESSPCAIVASDNIDVDDLHPYNALEFIRRDVTAAILLTEKGVMKHRTSTEDSAAGSEIEEEVEVVMRRASFMKIYRPSLDIPEETLLHMNERILQWPKVMMQTIREMINAHSR